MEIDVKAKDILIAAKNLITDKEHWTTGTFARDKGGLNVAAYSKDAFSYCSLGAVSKICDDIDSYDEYKDANRYLKKSSGELFSLLPAEVNDRLGHDEVMQMFDKAIEIADKPL